MPLQVNAQGEKVMDRLDRIEKIMEELSVSQRETDCAMKETDRQIKTLGREIGGLGNMFGNFTEGLMQSSLSTILIEEFKLDHILRNMYAPKQRLEYDMIAYANTTVNEVMIVEIKSHLSPDAIEQLQRQMEAFPLTFPEHKDKKLYGAIATVAYKKDLRHLVWDAGFYYFCMTNDLVKMHLPPKFKPKDWR